MQGSVRVKAFCAGGLALRKLGDGSIFLSAGKPAETGRVCLTHEGCRHSACGMAGCWRVGMRVDCGFASGFGIVNNAYRQGDRMARYVPEGIVGAFAGDKYFS